MRVVIYPLPSTDKPSHCQRQEQLDGMPTETRSSWKEENPRKDSSAERMKKMITEPFRQEPQPYAVIIVHHYPSKVSGRVKQSVSEWVPTPADGTREDVRSAVHRFGWVRHVQGEQLRHGPLMERGRYVRPRRKLLWAPSIPWRRVCFFAPGDT